MRVSDAERDQAAEVLRDAAAEGRITFDELDERLDAAYAARTYADLEPVTSDLPTGARAPAGQTPATAGGRPPERGDGGDALVVHSQGSVIVRKGRWRVPHRVEVYNKHGITRLDFRGAALTSAVVEVHIDTSFGMGDLVLPEGSTAEVDVDSSWFGALRSKVDSLRGPSHPHFVITGTCQGGSLQVRHKRPFSWTGPGGLGG
ncbi:DUF1707 SHOCT-like domain-containing protein [Nocardiopsis quinghaiensis]|uniref:DUF1707 SHOCT-like domain-containing protein n=1 Tax=Nocardiopsis quinghaiensis TaxID=464995 RepID=UPI0016806FB3|nr:DUF1707 domain-containing protein [Nocardiopsis quinghaiensis]